MDQPLQSSQLTTFGISYNSKGLEGVIALAAAPQGPNFRITSLTIRWNDMENKDNKWEDKNNNALRVVSEKDDALTKGGSIPSRS